MTHIRKPHFKAVSSAIVALVLVGMSATTTAGVDGPASEDAHIEAAIAAAANGADEDLDHLLKGPLSAEVQAALREWLIGRGDFDEGLSTPVRPVVRPRSTGTYEYYCTSYAGQSMGWNGKDQLACHGWMDVYISGGHVAHYCPDLIPRGQAVPRQVVSCTLGVIGTVASLMAPPPAGQIGWARYGIGVIAGGSSFLIGCG